MAGSAGIAGAGLMGRMLAEELSFRGWMVTLFDRDATAGTASCGHVGAGMLAPWCELEHAAPPITELGDHSLTRWPAVIGRLVEKVFFQREGSVVVAHRADRPELRRLASRVRAAAPEEAAVMRDVDAAGIARLEPELKGRFTEGLFFPTEGQVDNRQLMKALAATLWARNVVWRAGEGVVAVEPGRLVTARGEQRFDVAIDCRGLGAQEACPGLRGVRGEVVRVSAPDVSLSRPIRLMHPRYPLYVVPRETGVYVIGATSIESEDFSPPSVLSLLELLSAAYALHPGFAEARLLSCDVNCRPAFPDNLPRIVAAPGLLRINGLYRHGFLLAPALAEAAADCLEGKPPATAVQSIMEETP